MSIAIVKNILMWSEAGLIGALALKVFGVQIIQSWGAWWLLQIIIALTAAAIFIRENKDEVAKHIEDIKKNGSL